MKVTAFELQLWEKLLLKHSLLSKPQIDASIAAWRSLPANSTTTLAQMFEKQGVKQNHTRQLSDFIKQTITQAHQAQQAQQAPPQAASKPASPSPTPAKAQTASPAPAPAQARPAPAQPAPSNSLSAPIAGITDADLSIEGLDFSPPPIDSPPPTPGAQAFVPPPGAMAAKKPLKLEDPVLAPKFAGNEDLMPNENENVRWAPSDAEWADELKSEDGPRKSDIQQIDLADEPEDPNKPRPKIFKQDNASEWYGAIGAVLNSAGEKKSDDIPILDFDGTLEEPGKPKTPPPAITHSVPTIGKTSQKAPEIKKP